MKTLILYTDTSFSNPIEYTFNLMMSIIGVEYDIFSVHEIDEQLIDHDGLVIVYSPDDLDIRSKYKIQIYQSSLFGKDYLTHASMPSLPLNAWYGLPVIYQGAAHLPDMVSHHENHIETTIDIVASSFFMLSRYEEIVSGKRDSLDRFPATASIAYQEGFITRPIVNEYIDLFRTWINRFAVKPLRDIRWQGKEFAVCLTHDVDVLYKYRWHAELQTFGHLMFQQRQVAAAMKRAIWSVPSLLKLTPDPFWTFDHILDTERRLGMKSSFYFMSGGDTAHDGAYEIDRAETRRLIGRIESEGHEVGLHGSYNSYNNLEQLSLEKVKLDQVAVSAEYGARQHFLRWKTPDTWRALEQAGLKYDTSLGFADHEGFRCGMCLPYRPFDVVENRVLDLWELPLMLMEATLYRYRTLSVDNAWQSIQGLLETVRKHHGVFVLLWHNSALDERSYPGCRLLYERLMSWLGANDVLVTSGREIVDEVMDTFQVSHS